VDDEFDVVVVGGGPVGLWLASELALAKVKVVVLERRTERVAQSRALAIHGRTLEVFALRGLAERFLACGRRIPTGHFGALDTPGGMNEKGFSVCRVHHARTCAVGGARDRADQ
jgi:2-polyprenyl-6-methoxyphenol hydroxylase-like FAD-dependent oxidoreductase